MKKLFKINELKHNIKFLGRTTFENENLALSWTDSGFEIFFFGEGVIINFSEFTFPDQPAYVKTTIDGICQKHSLVNGNQKILIENLSSTISHILKFEKISESNNAILINSLVFEGENTEILPPPAEKQKKIEFIGDSITCGYASIAAEYQTDYETFEQDGTKTYAYLIASYFDADIHIEAISGQGIVHACSGEKGIPFSEFFKLSSRASTENWDFSKWTPDIVVINGGSNDVPGNVTDSEMQIEATNFLKFIRFKYINAKIIWYYGLLNQNYFKVLEKVITDLNDKDIYFLKTDTGYMHENEIVVGHPNVKCHKRAANELILKIKEITNWD